MYGRTKDHYTARNCSTVQWESESLDLVVGGPSVADEDLTSYGVILRRHGFPEGAIPYSPDIEYVLDADHELYGGGAPWAADWDGDGRQDLFIAGYGNEVGGPGGFAVIAGWDIPWDEAEYW